MYLFIFTFWFHQKQFLDIYMIIDKVRCYEWICLDFLIIDVLNIYVSRISIDACKTRRSIHFCFSVLTFRFNIILSSCSSLLHIFLKICVCKRICCSRNFDINTIQTNLRYKFIFKALWKSRFSITPYYLTSMLVHVCIRGTLDPVFSDGVCKRAKQKQKTKCYFLRYILHFSHANKYTNINIRRYNIKQLNCV